MRKRETGKIFPDFRNEFAQLIRGRKFGRHAEFLLQHLGAEHLDVVALFRYGMDNLPDENHRPDTALASYFLCLSEIADLPDTASGFAVDAMVYCETDEYDGMSVTLAHLQTNYTKEIAPLFALANKGA